MEKMLFLKLAMRCFILFLTMGHLTLSYASLNENFEKNVLPNLPPAKIEVISQQEPYSINHNISISKLHSLLTKRAYSDTFVFGLTSLKTIIRIDYDGTIITDKKLKLECLSPKLTIEILHPEMTVYIGREFNKGTCSYNTVLEHEMGHVKLYEERLPELQKDIQKRFNESFFQKRIIAQEGQAYQVLAREIDELWMPAIKAELW